MICRCILQDTHLGGVGGDGVEDVDEDEEEGDEEGHPARDDIHRDEEGDPRNNHKQACALILNANGCLNPHHAKV